MKGILLAMALAVAPTLQGTAQPAQSPAPTDGLRRQQTNEDIRVLRDLEYVSGGHERQKLDLYLPKDKGSARPLVIWIHGGAWLSGSKDHCPAAPLLKEGYAVASINYRLSQHAIFPAQIEDCKAAVRWLRAHAAEYGIDPNRFAAWGASAGGHLAALLGTAGDVKEFDRGENLKYSSAVQVVVDYFGPTDLLKMGEQSDPKSKFDHNGPDSPESRLVGGAVQLNPKQAKRASPITFVSKKDAPMLLVHGTADPLVPAEQSRSLYNALIKKKVPAKLHLVEGAGHGNGFGPREAAAVKQFLAQYLKEM
jgi:acetyl esterase/lipase